MPKKAVQPIVNELPLVKALEEEARAWADQGWPGVTQTTHDLLAYWFERDEEDAERFHDCQRRAIEVIIYCHEILGFTSLKDAYERLAPDVLAQSAALYDEVASIPFPKYALKMATGTGKTWVLAALLVWQYFNKLNGENDKKILVAFYGCRARARGVESLAGYVFGQARSKNRLSRQVAFGF